MFGTTTIRARTRDSSESSIHWEQQLTLLAAFRNLYSVYTTDVQVAADTCAGYQARELGADGGEFAVYDTSLEGTLFECLVGTEANPALAVVCDDGNFGIYVA